MPASEVIAGASTAFDDGLSCAASVTFALGMTAPLGSTTVTSSRATSGRDCAAAGTTAITNGAQTIKTTMILANTAGLCLISYFVTSNLRGSIFWLTLIFSSVSSSTGLPSIMRWMRVG